MMMILARAKTAQIPLIYSLIRVSEPRHGLHEVLIVLPGLPDLLARNPNHANHGRCVDDVDSWLSRT